MATFEQAKTAKEELSAKFFNEQPWKKYMSSIGVVREEESSHVSIGLIEEAPEEVNFPSEHNGVRVVVSVVGRFYAL